MRLRVRFSKLGKVRWISHRDVARCLERAFRRVDLPVAYSGGFSPRPKVSFGLALPTGAESEAEYFDVQLVSEIDVDALPARLSAALPVGIDVQAAVPIDDRAGSLQEEVVACRWELSVRSDTSLETVRARVDEALSASELLVNRERKGVVVNDDIRPAILSLEALETAVGGSGVVSASAEKPPVTLAAVLATTNRGLRPAELAAALGLDPAYVGLRRTHQWIERDGARIEPLALAGPLSAGLAAERLNGGQRRAG
ncbi:MAG TPA: TIGR03936 family radical SAM-associated protein [Acidimicrobiales bacterium]|nr:TIGR03936 family radical SAM-associated protein [Acidimicrobiales bacterium]